MKYIIFTFTILIGIYLLIKLKKYKYEFLSREHTNCIKGIAILLVILSHLGGIFGIRYLTPLGGIGVAMFLIVSGYGLTLSYERNGLNKYWDKKIMGVLIPYMIVEIFITLFRTDNTLINILGDLLILKSKHPYGWYLKCLLFWYIIFYIIGKLNLLSKSKVYLFYIVSLIIIMNENQLWAEQAFSFTLGVTLAYYKDIIINTINKKYISYILLFIGILFLVFKQIDAVRELHYIVLNNVQLMIKLPIACALIIYTYNVSYLIKANIFMQLGSISYSLYLIHGYTIRILSNLNYKNIILFFVITLIISVILERYILNNIRRYISKYKISTY